MKQVFLKNGPQKGGRPTNEYRLTGTPPPPQGGGGGAKKREKKKLTKRTRGEQEGTFNQHNLEGVNYFTPCYCYH